VKFFIDFAGMIYICDAEVLYGHSFCGPGERGTAGLCFAVPRGNTNRVWLEGAFNGKHAFSYRCG